MHLGSPFLAVFIVRVNRVVNRIFRVDRDRERTVMMYLFKSTDDIFIQTCLYIRWENVKI